MQTNKQDKVSGTLWLLAVSNMKMEVSNLQTERLMEKCIYNDGMKCHLL